MIIRCTRRIPTDTAFALRPRCSNLASLFTRTQNGKLRPLCAQCLENVFDDIHKRVSLEEGMDEWTIQEIMER